MDPAGGRAQRPLDPLADPGGHHPAPAARGATGGGGVAPAGQNQRQERLFRITFVEGPRTAPGPDGGTMVEAKIHVEVANAA